MWRTTNGELLANLAADLGEVPFQPWAATLFNERQHNDGAGRPSTRCLPRGLPGALLVRDHPWKIVQTPGVIVILFDEFLQFRQIFTDGRGFPEDPVPTWFGYSIGRWEGDTLVVETTGFNDETWLDAGGHPHSEAMHLTERFRRATVGSMEVDVTISDAEAYARPWGQTLGFELRADTDLAEHVCPVLAKP